MMFWFFGCQLAMGPSVDEVPAAKSDHATLALITIDTWRADHLSKELTPSIWALSEAGERYENAWSPMGLTTPAHASMLTGLMPWDHGAWANNHHGYAVNSTVELLPERYADWATGAFVSAYPAGPEGGLDRGWERFDGPQTGERPGGVAVERALDWLPSDRPALLWVHVYEPHGPYEGRGLSERERYAEEVQLADRLLTPLIDVLKARQATIVVTSDHGEVLDEERCSYQHERSISEHVLRVPMVRWGPGIEPRVVTEWVGLSEVPALLNREPVSARDRWVGQSGMCESDCAPGCAPAGLQGRDTVAIDAGGRQVNRPGKGRFTVGQPLLDLGVSLDAVPPVPPPLLDRTDHARSLGYIDPPDEP